MRYHLNPRGIGNRGTAAQGPPYRFPLSTTSTNTTHPEAACEDQKYNGPTSYPTSNGDYYEPTGNQKRPHFPNSQGRPRNLRGYSARPGGSARLVQSLCHTLLNAESQKPVWNGTPVVGASRRSGTKNETKHGTTARQEVYLMVHSKTRIRY